MPEWAEELAKTKGQDGIKSETEEYGISHFTIRILGRPFHAQRWCVRFFNCCCRCCLAAAVRVCIFVVYSWRMTCTNTVIFVPKYQNKEISPGSLRSMGRGSKRQRMFLDTRRAIHSHGLLIGNKNICLNNVLWFEMRTVSISMPTFCMHTRR